MFRKYTALAASWLLMVSITTAMAECTACPAGQMGSIPTETVVCGSNCHADTTASVLIATNAGREPTSGAICSSYSHCVPTMLPQLTGLIQASEAAISTSAPSTGVDYTTQAVLMQEQRMANLLNLDRKNNGRAALTLDAELSRIARIKSADMRDQGYFAHESPTYGNVRDMLKRFGYPYAGAGENIAHHANVDKAQAAFMSSPGHRANILSAAWTKMGIGIAFDRNGYIYATQIFAR